MNALKEMKSANCFPELYVALLLSKLIYIYIYIHIYAPPHGGLSALAKDNANSSNGLSTLVSGKV